MTEHAGNEQLDDGIAIVGMAGRFPGARDVGQLWRNLCDGVESITRFTDEELLAAGVTPQELADPGYVKANPVLDDIELFDAGFFGIAPTEAKLMDPQQRVFLEVAWSALEAAGCDPGRFPGAIGVFAGAAMSTYLIDRLLTDPDLERWASLTQVVLANDKDSLSTRVAHAFDLRGPSYSVQSYCSTSLVAVSQAASSLLGGECDVALAGGVAISVPHRVGYQFQEGGISSPDGSCRAFDRTAEGTPTGNGAAVVVLKRLADALADGDHVHAVIRGWAVNNDGALKAGYTAPGVRGQAAVIAEAIANAGVDPATIGYVEAHGTGTALGDAAEIAALTKAFGPIERCAIGSAKTNLGHLDRAAGVTGLIKAALAVEHGVIPPSLHFTESRVDLGPFEVQRELGTWQAQPRRAGVSAFGIGGTNAHVVLEQAPSRPVLPPRPGPHVLLLSARSEAAVDERAAQLASYLRNSPGVDLADVARTLRDGRAEFEHRRAVVATDVADAVAALEDPDRVRGAGGSGLVKSWLAGEQVEYSVDGSLIPLPTYPFQRERHWVDSPGSARNPADWLRVPRFDPAPVRNPAAPEGPFLIFCDRTGLGEELADALAPHGDVLKVWPDGHCTNRGEDECSLRPDELDDYVRLLDSLPAMPRTIVHLWGVTGVEDTVDQQLRYGFHSVITLAKALSGRGSARLAVVADGLHRVDPADPVSPGKAAVLGPALVVPQEYPGLSCRTIDVRCSVEDLVAELGWAGTDTRIALRHGRRLVQRFVAAPVLNNPIPLKDNGVYILTGGLGKVGRRIAADFARRLSSPKLVLTGRRGVADDLRELEDAGAEVLVLAADAADPDAMANVVRATRERFGAINGVVHGIGLTAPEEFHPIETMTRENAEAHFTAKIHSLLALDRALDGEELDFCVLQSSISAVLGGLGFAAYAGANAFLDSFAQSRRGWISVNWDSWRETLADSGIGDSMRELSMSSDEGLRALESVLANPAPQVLIALGALEERLDQWVRDLGTVAGPVQGLPSDRAELERRMSALWRQVLGVDELGLEDNFFDSGGNSLMGLQLVKRIGTEFGRMLPAAALFEAPTVRAMVRYLEPSMESESVPERPRVAAGGEIAIIGLAGRFPGADDVDGFWRNLCDGVESISFFSREELIASGVPAAVADSPDYVPARAVLSEVDTFDAAFFGFSPREAELTDPQHRLFLETSWTALERAGYATPDYSGRVGVFGGCNLSTYLMRLAELWDGEINDYEAVIGNDKDSLTTTVSYKLNLRGPSMAVQTFCSTSLVATHMAVRSLRDGECDIALAGGVSVRVPDRVGHRHQEGGMESPDGHVRTFDAAARGSMFGDGVGVVALKRLADALADGDHVHAVIKGSAVNNDGSGKVGFTAPSVSGQAEVVRAALRDAGVAPETISYVEAHGTGTSLGDPIEVASLTKAFGDAPARGSCAIGSVKTNVGHLDRAAGTSGLIKVALALEHKRIPPSLNFTEPNPEIDFEHSPFTVITELREWAASPRRAGLNSLGMGGTNAHVVLEEAPEPRPTTPGREHQLITLSARTETALAKAAANLAEHLRAYPGADLADAAHTLQVGRRTFEHRMLVPAVDRDQTIAALEGRDPGRVLGHTTAHTERPIGLIFGGVGEQYPGLAADLYREERVFREVVDECCSVLEPLLGTDLRTVLFAEDSTPDLDLAVLMGRAPAAEQQALSATVLAQPGVFVIGYAVAELLRSWGVQPDAMAGHSIGEYVAATVAGVLSLPDALRLVAHRARLIDGLEKGAMVGVSASAETLTPLLGKDVSLAAINAPELTVASGPVEAVAELERVLADVGIAHRRLDTTHAFHSTMLEGIAAELTEWVRSEITLSPPRLRYVSGVTGTWARAGDVTDPGYWARHMCGTVRFADAVEKLLDEPDRLLVEVAPGRSLGTFVRQYKDCPVLATLPARYDKTTASATVHEAVGRMWLLGARVDWAAYHQDETRRRIPLPTYPFERQRYWINTDARSTLAALPRLDPADWFCLPTWRQTAPSPLPSTVDKWMVLGDGGIGEAVRRRLTELGAEIVEASPRYVLDLRGLDGPSLENSYYEPIRLAKTLTNARLVLATTKAFDVTGTDPVEPGRATAVGPAKLLPIELGIRCTLVDLADPARGVDQLIGEALAEDGEDIVAWRGGRRWVPAFEPVKLAESNPLRDGGVYVITGGLGGIGLAMAQRLAETVSARLVLLGRTPAEPDSLQDLRAKATAVVTHAVDVADREALRGVIADAHERFGRIDGVIHAAGVPGIGLLQMRTDEALGTALRPKVDGTEALLACLDEHEQRPDFVALFSSIASVTGGGPGQVDYCAANAYLDAFVRSGRDQRIVAINWGEWQWNAWSEGLSGYDGATREYFVRHRERFGITEDEGWQAFLKVLGSQHDQVVVSTQDFREIAKLAKDFTVDTVLGGDEGARHPRPALVTSYEAPRTPTEKRVAELWGRALGVNEVGVHDNFFELGGNSLLGVDLVGRIRAELDVASLSPQVLYLAPTVAQLAGLIDGEDVGDADGRRDRGARRRKSVLKRGKKS
ncbi:SDR family NAD(P)-dependent oxidoreductase [Allokutzneria sp. A3M-2-11 16]|uniref:type I polyketide synthase n=1 Tax=Allokutzneria sp. A3M-2-11 16 TaxID=2962043 RepID=UPI0020B6A055|nr:type I polyketide synthase [Allokutzneria sp. A3M-2-11 16]MCP3805305.1 SDR family NAD(P)-dependent oxidoreductase [Allokutzneria sp. A3M-2-11 16]